MVERNNFNEDEGLAPPDKKLASLPPKIAAKIRRQRARHRFQEREEEPEPLAKSEEDPSYSPGEPDTTTVQEAEVETPALASPEEEPLQAPPAPTGVEPPVPPTESARHAPADPQDQLEAPLPARALDIKPRKVPTVSGLLQELGRGAWEGISELIESNVKRLKRRRALGEDDYLLITEEDLLDRRQKIRGYVLLSSAIHVLFFLPLISLAMLKEPEKKSPIYVRILETPPPAERIEKKPTKSKTPKTTKKVRKVVKARGPRTHPRPVTRPTPTKTYASPKKMLVAKASRPELRAPSTPKVPKPAPARLEAPRPKTTATVPPSGPVAKVTTPTKPLTLPETLPKVASLSETVHRRVSPVETRPTAFAVKVPTVPDTEGRVSRLTDAVPESFQARDRLAAPTAAPPLPPSQTPTPSVLGQAATVVSKSAPESPSVLAPEEAGSIARPVDERRTAHDVEARLGGEAGHVSPTQPLTFEDANELGPIGVAPTEFQEEITLPLNSDDPRFKEYLEAVRRRILEAWYTLGGEGHGLTVIEFSIERDGSVSRVKVNETSGYPVLDRRATDATREASPFLPLPLEFKTNRLNLIAGFRSY